MDKTFECNICNRHFPIGYMHACRKEVDEMKTIYKMILPLGPSGILTLRGADLLSVKGQRGRIVAYFLVPVTDKVETERHDFFVVPTGVSFNFPKNGMEFIDTVMLESGNLVYHVFKQDINK